MNRPDQGGEHLLMDSWKEHAGRLAVTVASPGSRWRDVVACTPRHLFVPRWWASRGHEWELREGDSDCSKWLAAAYRNWTLVTRVGDVHADHARPGALLEGAPTSSSTLPGLLVQMFRHASIATRSTVLDVGTGSGYGTALLCARQGHARITAIDVDPYLTSAAEKRLDMLGYRPTLLTADVTAGELPGQWDRIIATVAVKPIPPALLAALRTGGRLVTTITGTSMIITADKQEDGGAVGRVEWDRAGFMRARSGNDYPVRNRGFLERACTEEGEQVDSSHYPVMEVAEAWDVGTMLEILAPGIEHRLITYDDKPDKVALMAHEDGSWARAEERDGKVTVHQGGPRRLYGLLDQVRGHWLTYGELPIRGAQATISPQGVITLRRGRWTATIR
ncbi:methyltransferase domain-containing protein [Nonomuraea sp. NPDC050404]|uniref:methyltransferase domain-containing protein n=1 Tax=Nonomuraea sp. NPDC050404 TaxID=3155783 RepID=UPI0034049EA6